jgi:hypothetical protein
VQPQPRDADELHDLLMTLFVMRPAASWQVWFAELASAGRAAEIRGPFGVLWCAAERRGVLAPLFPGPLAGL